MGRAVIAMMLVVAACDEQPQAPPDGHADAADTLAPGDTTADSAPDGAEDVADATVDTVAPTCTTLRDDFVRQAWTPLLEKVCITCHQPGGLAWEEHARFSIVPATYPGFVDQNLDAVRAMAGYEYEGQPLLLAKPTLQAPHMGGLVLEEGSAAYASFKAFLEQLAADDGVASTEACEPPLTMPELVQLDPAATLRKASLALVGRLPTEAELARAQDEDGLRDAVLALMDAPAFDDWLVTNWNDVLLTDLYGSFTGRALGLLNDADFPAAHAGYYDGVDDASIEKLITTAVMREPLRLIVHVVREGRPFGEILTADYTMLNPYSARIYQSDATFADDTDANDWQPAHVTFERDGQTIAWPHAGILSSPMVLNRRPTTPTNLNRHRAWWVLDTFLATDILTVADRPVDPDAASRFDYPWRQDNQCVVCHAVIDPIAGAFSQFDNSDQERYFPDKAPPANVFDPGFGERTMPPDPDGGRLRWLAEQIVEDQRFPLAVARLTFEMLTGRKPIEHPRHPEDPDYALDATAWADFDRVMTEVTARFTTTDQDYRELVAALVMSPYFRAAGLTEDVDGYDQVGTARLLTPEALDLKIAATTGVRWARAFDQPTYLAGDYEILYGGIDSDRVVDRLVVPNGVMAAVQARMANEVACVAAPFDFSKPKAERVLFPTVEIADMPTTLAGDDVPAAAERIRATIAHLHEHLLGERASDDELARTYALFQEVAAAGRANVAAGTEPTNSRCTAKKDPLTGADLPDARKVERDVDYGVRAWIAVVSYLLSDYRFLYE